MEEDGLGAEDPAVEIEREEWRARALAVAKAQLEAAPSASSAAAQPQPAALAPLGGDHAFAQPQTAAAATVKRSSPHCADEDLGEERLDVTKPVYGVCFPHPTKTHAANGVVLRKPGDYAREAIRDMLLAAMEATQHRRLSSLKFTEISVFRERHRSGEVHYHAAVRAHRGFRFLPLKNFVLATSGLATHWSTHHLHYASAVAYNYLPSPTKPEGELDPEPLLWPAGHAPLAEASRPPVTAAAIAAKAEKARKARAGQGKEERRFEEMDLWPIVVNEGIKVGPDATDRVIAYSKRCGGPAMVRFCFQNEGALG